MAAHRVPGYGDLVAVYREKLGDQFRQLAGDVVEHVVMLGPLWRCGVQVEARPASKVVTFILFKYF